MKALRVVALSALVLSGTSASADEPRPVSLREALALAAKYSPDVATAQAQAQVAQAGVKRAWTAWQPDLSASGTFDHTSAPQTFDVGGLVKLDGYVYGLTPQNPQVIPGPVTLVAPNSEYGTLQLVQPLFTPQGAFLIGAAQTGAKAAALGAAEAREQVLLGTARAYLSLAAVTDLLAAAHDAEQTALEREQDAQRRIDAGVGLPLELTRAKSQTAQARAQIAALQGDRAALLATLVQLTGQPVAPAKGGGAESWGAPADPSTDPWEHTYAVQSAATAVEAAHKTVRYDTFAWLPTLAGVAKGNYNSNSGFANKNTSYDLLLTATVPLYDRGTRYAAKTEDEAKLAQAEAALAAARARARATWEGARANLAAAQSALEQAQANLTLAEQARAQVEAAYQGGTTTNLDLAEADSQRFQAAAGLAQAKANLEIRKVEVVAAEGRLYQAVASP